MLNEGLIVNDSTALMKSEIVNQSRLIGPTSPKGLEQAVFRRLVGHDRDEVNWDIEDNQAGYFTWVKEFDRLIHELVEDGYLLVDEQVGLAPTEPTQVREYSYLVYPPTTSK